jgi:hypothetical protein
VAHLEVEVVLVHLGAELHFLDLDDDLVLLRRFFADCFRSYL